MPAELRQKQRGPAQRETRKDWQRKSGLLNNGAERCADACPPPAPPPLRCTGTHRCLPAASLPIAQEHSSLSLLPSLSRSLSLWRFPSALRCLPPTSTTDKPAPLNMIYSSIIKGQRLGEKERREIAHADAGRREGGEKASRQGNGSKM